MSQGEGQINKNQGLKLGDIKNHKGEYKRSTMKNRFTKILGVVLTLAVLASMLVVSTPASAGYEAFSRDSQLSLIPGMITTGSIVDMAVTANGSTAYATTTDNNSIWKTTDGGHNWAQLTSFAGGNATKISVASDSADYVAVIADTNEMWVTLNGGVTWGQTSKPTFDTVAYDVAVGPVSGSGHLMAVGTDTNTWVYGPLVGDVFGSYSWTNVTTSGNVTAGATLAVQFSPGYASDYTLVTVSADGNNARLNVYNVLYGKWNADYAYYGASNGGALLSTGLSVAATNADIALPGTYSGFDALRTAYVSLNNFGIFRNTTAILGTTALPVPVYSIVLNAGADKLSAGLVGSNMVYSAASPSGQIVTFTASSPLKSPGGTGNVSVDYFGAYLGAGTQGNESAFALSSSGSTFNDVALIKTAIAITDFAVNSEASKFYMVSYNVGTGTTSIWRKTTAWERVYRVTGTNWIIRPTLGSFDVLFLAQVGAQNFWYSNDAGETTWQIKVGPFNTTVTDLQAESPSIIYVLNAAGAVAKSTDGAVTWPTSLTAVGAGGSMQLLSAGNLIIAGPGGVAYTTDASVTWTSAATVPGLAFACKYAIADKLTSGGIIFAASATEIKKFTIGTSVAFSTTALVNDTAITGIAQKNGVTYAMGAANLYRSPISSFAWGSVATSVSLYDVKAGGTNIYSRSADALYVYTEVFAAAGPAAVAPADNFIVPMNQETGNANQVVFQWTPIANSPLGTTYNLEIALDSTFTQVVFGDFTLGVVDGTKLAAAMAIIGPNAGLEYFWQSDTTYYWRVRVDYIGTSPVDSPWSTVRKFKIDTLAPVALVSPTNGAMNIALTPTFSWSPAAGATGYELVVSDDPTFAIITYSRTSTNAVFYSDEELAYSTVYYWKVRPTGTAYPAAGTPYVMGIFTTMAKPTETQAPITITNTQPTWTVEVPDTQPVIPSYLLWIIIAIGAILVIALIVLIVRTRRVS